MKMKRKKLKKRKKITTRNGANTRSGTTSCWAVGCGPVAVEVASG